MVWGNYSGKSWTATILGILKELTQFVAGAMKNNKDDELYRVEGTFLQDGLIPYHINRRYNWGNDYADLSVQVIPLTEANGQGTEIRRIELIH